ncbi:MAG: tRNA (adenosine(37)-N6)-threonylcarbamoyltransferase complex dimerization subunit type 1 TsaB [Sandaracinobacter sp.]
MPDSLGPSPTPVGRTLVIATGHDLSLALLHGDVGVASRHEPMLKGHAEALVPALAEMLAPFGGQAHRCDRIVVETGPGSFTGLRVGLAAARALALAWKAGLAGVRSTQLVAAEAWRSGMTGSLLVALAAPRGQIWVEGFAADRTTAFAPAALSPDLAQALAGQFDHVAGTAPLLQGEPLRSPRAAAVAALAIAELGGADILYVRAPDSR